MNPDSSLSWPFIHKVSDLKARFVLLLNGEIEEIGFENERKEKERVEVKRDKRRRRTRKKEIEVERDIPATQMCDNCPN